MKNRNSAVMLLLLLPLLTTVAGCGVFAKKDKVGPRQVDDLLGRIERVHIECELAEQAVRDALAALHAIVSPDFGGDPVAGYAEFVAAVEESEDHFDDLKAAVEPMKSAAGPFFEQWASNLSGFSSMDMRLRSQARLEATLERYDTIVATVEPTQEKLAVFNKKLRDHVLFLGQDFNAAAVAELSHEVNSLTREADQLDAAFGDCLVAAQDYVRSAAMPGQVELAQRQASNASE